MGKLTAVAFVAVGYVLGARAGRERYDQIADRATKIWKNPKVQQGVSEAEQAAKDVAKDTAPKIQQKVADAASKMRPKESSKQQADSGHDTTLDGEFADGHANERDRSVTIADFDRASGNSGGV